MPEYTCKVSPEDKGRRLDLFLAGFSKVHQLGLSRTRVKGLILEGKVKSRQKELVKPNYAVRPAEEILIFIEEKKSGGPEAENIPLEIIYQDTDLAVLNKPSGLVVHPAPGNYQHTLVNALLHHFKKLSDINPQRPGIVHRLDKETSGLLVVAKNNPAHLSLAKQFSEHSIKRRYVALVEGKMEFVEDIIEVPLARHKYKRKNMAVSFQENARYAKTHYRTLKTSKHFSLVELSPFTGRTHQIRVHMAFLGYPILGDIKYGKEKNFSRMALHAKYLGFMHPRTAKFVEFSCDLPKEFQEFIKKEF